MGYYTTFKVTMKHTGHTPQATEVGKYVAEFLGITPAQADEEEVAVRLEQISEYSFDQNKDGSLTMNGSWYDYEKDMVKLSKEYPFVEFLIEGEGEEAGDIWRAKCQNGVFKKQQARIVFDDWD